MSYHEYYKWSLQQTREDKAKAILEEKKGTQKGEALNSD